jgi:ketosteroid isomerase-like protein
VIVASQQNIDSQRKFAEAFRRGDWDAVRANIDPDILVRTDPRWPEQRIYGRDAWIAFLRGAWESWGPDNRTEEILDLGDRLLVRSCWSIRGQHSGVEGEQRFSSITTYREGRAVFIEFFLEHDQALKAVGLEG